MLPGRVAILVASGEALAGLGRVGRLGASSAASVMADRKWARQIGLYYGFSLVWASTGRGGGVVGVLQTRWGDEWWPLAHWP